MSAKVKKRFEEMQTYLGRDTEGLKKLKLLKDDVNELRTSLAAAKEQLEQMVEIKDAARERADAAEAELASVRLEQDRLNQKLQGLAKRATAAEAEIKKLTTSADDTGSAELSASTKVAGGWNSGATAYAVLSQLREGLPFCPRAWGTVFMGGNTSSIYLLTDIVLSGWTHANLWRLGAFVAIHSRLEGCVHIKSPDTSLMDYVSRNRGSRFSRCVEKWLSKVATMPEKSRRYEMITSSRVPQVQFSLGTPDSREATPPRECDT